MLINSKHLRRIYNFLKMMYEEREKFNKKLLDLKEFKVNMLENLKEYKM